MADRGKPEGRCSHPLPNDDGQYGECHGATLDSLIEKGLAVVQGEDSGLNNGIIAKGTTLTYLAVSITDNGLAALT